MGDVAIVLHEKPSINAMTVWAKIDDALAPPVSFSEVWNDRGSGADSARDVRVMKINPPACRLNLSGLCGFVGIS